MTTFAELYDQTIIETRRPELVAVTRSAVQTAVLRAHHTDFFPRDLDSTVLPYVVPNTAFVDFPTIGASLTRLRSIKSLKSVDTNTVPVEQLEYRDIDDLYDSDGCLRQSVYTMKGETVRAYPQLMTGYMEFFYFMNPVVTEVGFSSWIADAYMEEVARWAASIVFARSGFLEQAKTMRDDFVTPFKGMLVSSHLLGNVS
jgi:hypothetical protein